MIDSEATAYGLDQFLRLRHGGKIRGGDTAIGFDWHYERTLDDQNMRMLSPWDPADIPDYVAGRQKPPVDPDTILPIGELRYWNRETGVYVTHQEKFDRWTLTGGLRRGFYEAYSERDSLRERESAWTGQFGAVYDTKRDFYFYGHWHNSFEPDLALDENDALLPPPGAGNSSLASNISRKIPRPRSRPRSLTYGVRTCMSPSRRPAISPPSVK